MAERVEVRKTYKLYSGGEFVRSESGRSYRPQGSGANMPRASRKDLRESIRAARAALPGWSGRTAINRGQVLYRTAEMLDTRRDQFVSELGGGRAARREVDASVDSLVWFAGWADKVAQVAGTVNPVAGPYFNFSLPEPTGVVGLVAPERPALAPLVRHLAAILCGGNTVVVLASETQPAPALTLAEVLATSDFPPGITNILSGLHAELLPWLGSHMDVNAVDAAGCTAEQLRDLEQRAAANVKRVIRLRAADELSPLAVTAFMETKTVWHPIGV